MYYLRERSLQSDDPTLTKLRSDGLFFPRDRTTAYDWAMRGSYEDSIIQWAKTLLDPSKIFVDVGAHVGTYSIGLAPHCAGVVSFECFPRTYNYLCANIALRGLDSNITAHRTALGDTVGTTSYTIRPALDGGGNTCLTLPSSHEEVITLPITTLDSFSLSNVGLIKLDVEGFEQQVLQGAQETLRRSNYPLILFESWRPGRDAEGLPATRLRSDLFAYLPSIGYTIAPIRGWDEMFIAERTNATIVSDETQSAHSTL
jgi:FkbM family methyltransferase